MRVMPLIAVGLLVGIGTGWWLFGQRGAAVDIAPVDPASVIAVPGEPARSPSVTPEAVSGPSRSSLQVAAAAPAPRAEGEREEGERRRGRRGRGRGRPGGAEAGGVGAFGAFVCALHCLLVPVALLCVPTAVE